MTENPNAFKHWFDAALVRRMAERLQTARPGLDAEAFVGEGTDGLDALELKDRVRRLAEVVRDHLDPHFPAAVATILEALPPAKDTTDDISAGFEIWPYCHFVEVYGLDHLDASMRAMYELTQRFSAEFAVRPYLLRYPDEVLSRLQGWTSDPNPHVRRWVSEGTRPRLPWGMRLQPFVDAPAPIIPLLEALRNDPEEYVRRSVANNLNDIAKDHPDLVVEIARRWWGEANDDGRRMIKHALRTLIKDGHPGALALLGFHRPSVEITDFALSPAAIAVGDSVEVSIEVRSTGTETQSLLIDYAVHHVRANGSTSAKVFKWTTRELRPGAAVRLTRKHSMKAVTTRKYYPGEHLVEVFVNGESVGTQPFELVDA